MTTTIERRIYLEPKYLDSNIMKHLLKKIQKTTSNECTKEYGHILTINKVIGISANVDTIFTVKFEATTLKPEPGKIFDAVVCMIYKDGIFVNIAEKQKMLIPAVTLTDYKFHEEDNVYKNATTKKTIAVDDKIRIKITATKYGNQNFSCVGSLA